MSNDESFSKDLVDFDLRKKIELRITELEKETQSYIEEANRTVRTYQILVSELKNLLIKNESETEKEVIDGNGTI